MFPDSCPSLSSMLGIQPTSPLWKGAASGCSGSRFERTTPIDIEVVKLKPYVHEAGAAIARPVSYPNVAGEDLPENDFVIVQRFELEPGQWEGPHGHGPTSLWIFIHGGLGACHTMRPSRHRTLRPVACDVRTPPLMNTTSSLTPETRGPIDSPGAIEYRSTDTRSIFEDNATRDAFESPRYRCDIGTPSGHWNGHDQYNGKHAHAVSKAERGSVHSLFPSTISALAPLLYG